MGVEIEINQDLVADLIQGPLRFLEPLEQDIFVTRLHLFWPDVLRPLQLLYGEHPEFTVWCRHLIDIAAHGYASRPNDLRILDQQRLSEPDWFQQPDRVGYVAYTERFAGTLRGVADHIPYLNELGVNYLHLMPLLRPRPGPNDGGYAVADYREVNPELGTMADLSALTAQLRAYEISLCIDLVCNHTAREHQWAALAISGNADYQDYYLMFPDRSLPDQYEETLPEIFPEFKPGNFVYCEELDHWVWSTFHEYQWDLNYRNPAVLSEMLDNILYLANHGVEVMRLDAVAFMWKRLGTDSQNQPEAHAILQVFRALSRMAAPGLLLKAEAIVSPNKLVPYLGRNEATNKECELAYHNVYMVLLWSALAEQKVVLITRTLQNMPVIPSGTSWVTYVRCHDDIGWAVTDEDAADVGLSGAAHRAFLSNYYSGRFEGSYARGTTFQHNPRTGDRRISGACGSLAGLESAVEANQTLAVNLAIRRILLLHTMIFAFGGIPLIYMGDEIGMLNDSDYRDDPDLADDNRWMHRPFMDWQLADQRHDPRTTAGRIFSSLQQIARRRAAEPALHARAESQAVWTHNDQVFGLLRDSPWGRVLILANFSQRPQQVAGSWLGEMGFGGPLTDLLEARPIESGSGITLAGYEAVWLKRTEQGATFPGGDL